ncbi:MAG: SpoIIE family protein phosphatase [Deltaproteobacteria bacterium]|nr:SpoIIE family protein phosphatase [Deltaproteobacteria bacterium]
MTRFRLFCLKNAMFTANIVATAIGTGLLYIIYEFVLRGYQTDNYVEFHLRTANYFGPIFALFFVFIIWYEWPIRRYFGKLSSDAPISFQLESTVKKRLLNEPFFIIVMDMAAWISAGVAFAAFERNFGLSWQAISMNRFDALLAGLVSTTIAFFLLERILQSFLAPYVFPRGKLYDVKGTRRINLAVRLYAVFVAINLIPFLAILTSLYRVAASDRNALDSLKMLTTGLWMLIPVVVAIGGGLVLIVSLNLKKSLDAMVIVLKQVTVGKFGSRVKVTSNDEIGYVGDVINEMTEGLIERDRMRQSLDLAMEVQQNLLPKGNLKIDGFDIAGKSIYCDETGGDYYDFITMDEAGDKKIGVAIGDVSGHGIPAALLMATVRSSLRQRLFLPGSTAQIISDVNSQLVRDVEDSGQFMTLFYLTVDPVNQRLQWVRAGHDPGIFYDPATNTFEDLKGNGIALGVDESWQFEMNEKMGLAKGQIIVLSTDGVWEAHDQTGEIFGKARLYEIIRQNSAKKAEEIIEAVLAALDQFQKDSAIEDDITLVVIKIEEKFVNPDE